MEVKWWKCVAGYGHGGHGGHGHGKPFYLTGF